MITLQQLEKALEEKDSFKQKNVDHGVMVIQLLRERIPYAECPRIIRGAGYEKIWLPYTEVVTKYLNESDLDVLAECNTSIDHDAECLYLFV